MSGGLDNSRSLNGLIGLGSFSWLGGFGCFLDCVLMFFN